MTVSSSRLFLPKLPPFCPLVSRRVCQHPNILVVIVRDTFESGISMTTGRPSVALLGEGAACLPSRCGFPADTVSSGSGFETVNPNKAEWHNSQNGEHRFNNHGETFHDYSISSLSRVYVPFFSLRMVHMGSVEKSRQRRSLPSPERIRVLRAEALRRASAQSGRHFSVLTY